MTTRPDNVPASVGASTASTSASTNSAVVTPPQAIEGEKPPLNYVAKGVHFPFPVPEDLALDDINKFPDQSVWLKGPLKRNGIKSVDFAFRPNNPKPSHICVCPMRMKYRLFFNIILEHNGRERLQGYDDSESGAATQVNSPTTASGVVIGVTAGGSPLYAQQATSSRPPNPLELATALVNTGLAAEEATSAGVSGAATAPDPNAGPSSSATVSAHSESVDVEMTSEVIPTDVRPQNPASDSPVSPFASALAETNPPLPKRIPPSAMTLTSGFLLPPGPSETDIHDPEPKSGPSRVEVVAESYPEVPTQPKKRARKSSVITPTERVTRSQASRANEMSQPIAARLRSRNKCSTSTTPSAGPSRTTGPTEKRRTNGKGLRNGGANTSKAPKKGGGNVKSNYRVSGRNSRP
ncbi:hypothetical protein NMY22_g17310 [Coprinellus aureogranulatus]|nr:hypothetical protein NMY22_g17310 [Coprinellus aureogranulatus]